jgi:hypothetical protein
MRLDWAGSFKTGSGWSGQVFGCGVADRVTNDGQDTQMRPAMAEVGALDILPNHTAKPNLWSVGNQVARAHR